MKRSRFTEQQIFAILKEAEAGWSAGKDEETTTTPPAIDEDQRV